MSVEESSTTAHLEFHDEVKLSIELIGFSVDNLEDDALLKYLSEKGIRPAHALEIITFLPIAFTRKMLPTFHWRRDYLEYISENEQKIKSFTNNNFYKIIEEEIENYCNQNPKKEVILKIAGRSAEFKVINELLLKNEDVDIAKITLTKMVVLRTKE